MIQDWFVSCVFLFFLNPQRTKKKVCLNLFFHVREVIMNLNWFLMEATELNCFFFDIQKQDKKEERN